MSDLNHRQIAACERMLPLVRNLLTDIGLALEDVGPMRGVLDALDLCIARNREAIAVERGPECVAAEQSVLGALLIDCSALDRITISVQDFVLDSHRRIYTHICKSIARGDIPDIVTVWESICASNERDQVGGLVYLGELAANCPSSAGIASWARIVREKAEARRKPA